MSDFDDLVKSGAAESARLMNDVIVIDGVNVPSIFDDNSMVTGIERFGDTEDITATAVVSLADLPALPTQKSRVYRNRDQRYYFITSVSTDAGHCELSLMREGAKHGS